MSPTRLRYKELGLEPLEPLQDQPHKSRQPPMVDEKKDKGVGDPLKILLEEALEQQRNAMIENFSQIFQRLPTMTHLLPTATLEVPHPLKYNLTLTFPYLRVR